MSNRPTISDKIKIRLWILAGGRCQYEGCNVPLWRDDLTMAQMNGAYIAHIIDVNPQTAEAREVTDRPWTDMYWQSSGVFAASCHTGEDPTYTGAGMDYLIAYWAGVRYGLLPGGGVN